MTSRICGRSRQLASMTIAHRWPLVAAILLVTQVLGTSAFPFMAIPSSACETMMPQHGAPVQTSAPPYSITFSPSSYTPGSTVSVTLTATGSQPFKGFMVQARRDGQFTSPPAFGSFTVVPNTRQVCPETLTHSTPDDKTSLTLQWTAPDTAQGDLVFVATFVQEMSLIWRYVTSDTLSGPPAENTNPGGVDPTTQPPIPAGSIGRPAGCGDSRGCFSLCPSSTRCDFFLAWNADGTDGSYTMVTSTSSATPWMAFGLSSDSSMGNDGVIGCAGDESGNVILFTGRTTGQSPPVQYSDSETILTASSFQNGVLSCSFTRPIAASADGRRNDISQAWTILFAYGTASISAQTVAPGYHATNRYISSSAYTINSIVNDGASALKFPRIKAHGSLMIGAWIFFASIGIIVARYYKPVWTVTLFSQKVWFQIHRTCMVLVLCCTVAGFILIFVEVEGWSDLNEPDSYLDAHPIMGVIVTGLTVANPVMALFRPHPGTSRRPIFNWAHWFVGTGAHILGVATIFFGVRLAKADGPDYLVYILAGYVGWQVLVSLLLELLQCTGRKSPAVNAYEMQDMNAPKPSPLGDETHGTLTIKQIILFFHIFVVAAVSAVLIAIISVGESEL